MQILESWRKDRSGQALMIMGARQVGKTTLVREFARVNYKELAEINFYERPEAKDVLSEAKDTSDLLLRISVLAQKEIRAGETLLFLDEIQECQDMLTWIKFLAERTDLDIILSGSLLGLDSFVHVRSLPVGFLRKICVYPFSFEEFCRATGVPKSEWDAMVFAIEAKDMVPDFIHDDLMARFRKYLLVGGMPDAVRSYVDAQQIVPVRNRQRAIVDLYKDDIAKYVKAPVESRQIKMVYEAIPGQLNAQTKRFTYARLGKNLRFANMETAFDWLQASGVAIESTRVGEVVFPLGLSEDRRAFKLFMNDVGLLTSQLMGDVEMDVLTGAPINYGSIFENYVAQELRASGYLPHYYYSRKNGEVDFVIENSHSGEVKVIEVKSGKDYKRHSALNNLMDSGSVKSAIILHDGNVSADGGRLYLPIYATGLL